MALSGRAMLALLVILGVHSASAMMYTVGGSGGWNVQNSNSVYDNQFKSINLVVGDSLLFPYTAPQHNVFEIIPANLPSCNFAKPIQTFTQSNPVINLTTAGVHAYACEVPTHCSQFGMALSVTVNAAAPGAAPSSPPTPAPTKAPAPATKAPTRAPSKAPASNPTIPGITSQAPAPSPTNPAGDATIISSGPAMVVAAIVAGLAFLVV